MHTPDDVNITYVPQDFKVACVLFNIPIDRFLQLFIDHVSFYDALFPGQIDPVNLATRTLSKYAFEKSEINKDQSNHQNSITNIDESKKAIREMAKISSRNDLDHKQKRKRAKYKIEKLFLHYKTNSVKSQVLYLSEDQKLQLPIDFCLLCEVHQVNPIEHITNIMEQISVPDIEARNGLNKGIENPAVGFYLRVQNGYGNLYGQINHMALFFDYLDELQKLHLSLFVYRSVEARTEKYRELLNKYYHQLIS